MAAMTRNLGSVNRRLNSQLFSAHVPIMPGYLCLSIEFPSILMLYICQTFRTKESDLINSKRRESLLGCEKVREAAG